MIGPHEVFQVPFWMTGDAGQLVVSEELGKVLVLDMSLPGASSIISPFTESADMDLVNTFVHLDLQAHPDFPDLMLQVKAWLNEEIGDRVAFYSAEEGTPQSAPPQGAKAKAAAPGGTTGPGRVPGIQVGQKLQARDTR